MTLRHGPTLWLLVILNIWFFAGRYHAVAGRSHSNKTTRETSSGIGRGLEASTGTGQADMWSCRPRGDEGIQQ